MLEKTTQDQKLDEKYTLDHTIVVYLMGPDNKFLTYLGSNLDETAMTDIILDEISADLKKKVLKNWRHFKTFIVVTLICFVLSIRRLCGSTGPYVCSSELRVRLKECWPLMNRFGDWDLVPSTRLRTVMPYMSCRNVSQLARNSIVCVDTDLRGFALINYSN